MVFVSCKHPAGLQACHVLLLLSIAADVGPALKLVAAVRQTAMTKQQHDTGGLRMLPLLLQQQLLQQRLAEYDHEGFVLRSQHGVRNYLTTPAAAPAMWRLYHSRYHDLT
jgi:hypothetical protein